MLPEKSDTDNPSKSPFEKGDLFFLEIRLNIL